MSCYAKHVNIRINFGIRDNGFVSNLSPVKNKRGSSSLFKLDEPLLFFTDDRLGTKPLSREEDVVNLAVSFVLA